MLHEVYLGLGTNLGNREENIAKALEWIAERVGGVTRRSENHWSEPWGFDSENVFLNIVVAVHTKLTPLEVLDATQEIERLMGRTRKTTASMQYADRVIDIDILLYDDLAMQNERLTIPHPHIEKREFVRVPLSEVKPD